MVEKEKDVFETLNSINVNSKTETKDDGKNKLTYLSWAWAWAEVKKKYPTAQYEIKKFENNLPYVFDENTGYMVFTSVTIGNITHEMWLPVMNGNNKAMKNKPYTYTTKYGNKNVESTTMFDINKTIMRCLTKNLGMFGLGLYIYAGEDLPENEEPPQTPEQKPQTTVTKPKPANKAQATETKDVDVAIFKGLQDCQTIDELKAYYQKNYNKVKDKQAFVELKNARKLALEGV